MRKLFALFPILYFSNVLAVQNVPKDVPKTEVSVRKVGEYKSALKSVADWTAHLEDENYYGKIFRFQNKKTGETKKFADFEAFQKRIIYNMAAEEISKKLEILDSEVKENLDKLPADDGKEAADNEVPKKANLQKFLVQITEIRKSHATRWQTLVDKLFKDYPDKFTDKEKEHYLKNMREYNNKNKLIEKK